ncbi:hypothetical protein B0H11DRAFT_2214640 [Mycena galericulata]|nr:hypothetical protein B0H11DRAFT_2214640 [Mycena galericulata]
MRIFPTELVHATLELAVFPFHGNPLEFDERRLVVSHVCKRWRNIVSSSPLFWAYVFIDSHTPIASILYCLSRSGSLPIHIHIELAGFRTVLIGNRPHGVRPSRILDDILVALSGYLPRCTHLILRTEDSSSSLAVKRRLYDLLSPSILFLDVALFAIPWDDVPTSVITPVALIPVQVLHLAFHGLPMSVLAGHFDLTELTLRHIHDTSWDILQHVLESSHRLRRLELTDVTCPCFYSSRPFHQLQLPPLAQLMLISFYVFPRTS